MAEAFNPVQVTYGTTAGTAAAGNDSRIVGALQASSAVQAVSAATTLTAASLPKTVVCSGGGYTLTLAAASACTGQVQRIQIDSGATGLITLASGSDLIDGQATRILWAGEGATIYSDGTTWRKVGGRSRPMYCRMRRVAALNIPGTTFTSLQLDTTVTDTTGLMADTANHNIKILRGGIYQLSFSWQANGSGANASNNTTAAIFIGAVSGAPYASSGFSAAAGAYPTPSISATASLSTGNVVIPAAYQDTQANQAVLVGSHPIPLDVLEVPSW